MNFLKILLTISFTLIISHIIANEEGQDDRSGSLTKAPISAILSEDSQTDFSLEFEKSGLELSHSLLRKTQIKKDTFFYYRLHLASQQKLAGNEFNIVIVNEKKPQVTMKAWVDKNEKVWIQHGRDHVLLDEYELSFSNFSDGQFIDLVMEDQNKKCIAKTRICPKPIECKSLDGAILRLELISSEFGYYALEGEGFKPEEKLFFISQSEEETIPPSLLQAYPNGTFTAFLLPRVIGKTYGRASITVIRQDGSSLKVSYLWGITEEKLAALEARKVRSLTNIQKSGSPSETNRNRNLTKARNRGN